MSTIESDTTQTGVSSSNNSISSIEPELTPKNASAASSSTPSTSLSTLSVVSCHTHEAVPFTQLWSRSTTIVIFLRHFLCEACQEHMFEASEAFKRAKPQASTSDGSIQLAFVGCGKAKFGARLYDRIVGRDRPDIRMYVDESLQAYRAMGAVHARAPINVPFLCRNSLLVCWQGLTRCWCLCDSGDVKQQGGSFVMKNDGTPDGVCLFAHREHAPGDYAAVVEVFRAAGLDSKPPSQQMI